MTFDQYKKTVIRLAKQEKRGHLIPNNDRLYRLWEQTISPESVVLIHCTTEAQKRRFDE